MAQLRRNSQSDAMTQEEAAVIIQKGNRVILIYHHDYLNCFVLVVNLENASESDKE